MKLLDSLAHMPFAHGDDLYCCISSGPATISVPRTPTAEALNQPAQTVQFQPWTLAHFNLQTSELTPIEVSGLTPSSPSAVFCNPVLHNNSLTFVHRRTIYSAPLTSGPLQPVALKHRAFTGYRTSNLVYIHPGKPGTKAALITRGRKTFLPLDTVYRVIPHNNSHILTGTLDGELISILYHSPTHIERITTAGKNVYKCCIHGDRVIHAVRGTSFEERTLHSDPLTLLPF